MGLIFSWNRNLTPQTVKVELEAYLPLNVGWTPYGDGTCGNMQFYNYDMQPLLGVNMCLPVGPQGPRGYSGYTGLKGPMPTGYGPIIINAKVDGVDKDLYVIGKLIP